MTDTTTAPSVHHFDGCPEEPDRVESYTATRPTVVNGYNVHTTVSVSRCIECGAHTVWPPLPTGKPWDPYRDPSNEMHNAEMAPVTNNDLLLNAADVGIETRGRA